MFELLSVLMCGGGGYSPPPPRAPAPVKQAVRTAQPAITKKTSGKKQAPMATSYGGTLLTGTQGIGDQSLITGKSLLGG